MADELGKRLRYQLRKDLSTRNGGADETLSQDEENYMVDLIDYVVAMVKNGKPISYILDELKNMEMELFDWNKVGEYVEDFLRELVPKDNLILVQVPAEPHQASPSAHKSATDSRKMLHLKSNKSNALAMSGALGASREGRGHVPREKTMNGKLDTNTSGHSPDNQEGGIEQKGSSMDRRKRNDNRQGPTVNALSSGQDSRHPRPIGAQGGRGISQRSERGNIISREQEVGRHMIPQRGHSRNHPEVPRDDVGRGLTRGQVKRDQDRLDSKAVHSDNRRGIPQGSGRGRGNSNKHEGRDSDIRINQRETLQNASRGRGRFDERACSRSTHPDSHVSRSSDNGPLNAPSKTLGTKTESESKDKMRSRDTVMNNNSNVQPGMQGAERKSIKRSAHDLNEPAPSGGSIKLAEDKTISNNKMTVDSKRLNIAAKVNSDPNHLHTAEKDAVVDSTAGNNRQNFNRQGYRGGRSDFSAGRGRGHYRQIKSDNIEKVVMHEENVSTIPFVAKGQSSDHQVLKKARLSTDMEVDIATDPETQLEEAQKISNDIPLENPGQQYQQPYGHDYYDESQWYMEDPSYYAIHPYQWGRGRGFGRGYAFRGRSLKLGGRGVASHANGSTDSVSNNNETSNNEQPLLNTAEELTLAAASVSPSPLVAATFGDQLGHIDNSFSYRGRGLRGRGAGRGRAEVTAILASKSWSRAKAVVGTTTNEVLNEES